MTRYRLSTTLVTLEQSYTLAQAFEFFVEDFNEDYSDGYGVFLYPNEGITLIEGSPDVSTGSEETDFEMVVECDLDLTLDPDLAERYLVEEVQ
jgi:hypothetical protein